jgi:hypothetical protein
MEYGHHDTIMLQNTVDLPAHVRLLNAQVMGFWNHYLTAVTHSLATSLA